MSGFIDTQRQLRDFFNVEKKEFKCSKVSKYDESFEFALFFNSSEERSLEYNKLFNDKSIKYALIVDFASEDNRLKNLNLEKNKEYLSSKSRKYYILDIKDIFDYQNNLNDIISSIPTELFSIGAKFFMDITGAPLVYTIALLRYFKLSFPSPVLYLLNVSAGVYGNEDEGQPQFSHGIRENIFIPGFYGEPGHSLPYLYVFLLGYEGERSYNILTTNNPDFVEVLIPDPGYSPDNHHKTILYNKDFLKDTEYITEYINDDETGIVVFEYTEKNSQGEMEKKKFCYKEAAGKIFCRIDISKIDEVCDKILSIYEKFKGKAEIRLVPLGPKPHAIGAGLAGLIEENISIMYQTPKEYLMNQVAAGEKMWVYKID